MMPTKLSNRVAIVTGAGAGIGRGCATKLAAEGACVVLVDIDQESGDKTQALIRESGRDAVFIQGDVSQEVSCRQIVQTTIERFGRLDILVNCAGIYPRATLEETTEAFWDHVLAVNLKGPFFLCQHAVPLMRMQGGGSIINIGSVHGLGGAGKLVAYSVSKGGLLTLTKNLAVSLRHDKIRVNYVIPGWVLSPTELRTQRQEGHDAAWLEQRAETLGMGRFQTPEDTANTVAFLASTEGEMITGCVINVDAGYSVRCIGTEPE
jgi:NAD(P)-dependent dehydrogenase (short-subunit alcohol dehydrogenase family)